MIQNYIYNGKGCYPCHPPVVNVQLGDKPENQYPDKCAWYCTCSVYKLIAGGT